MKKIIVVIIIISSLAGGYFSYKIFFEESENLNSVYLIPRSAIFLIASNKPLKNWRKVEKSEVWNHLQTNSYFAELTKSAHTLDSILNQNKKLIDILGSKEMWISVHPISKRKYDYLFVIDLKKTAKLLQFKSIIKNVLKSNYRITERNYKGIEIIELFNKKTRETLYFSVINNNLITSFTHTLIEASISQLNEPTIGRDLKFLEVNTHLKDNQLFRFFIQYNYIDEYAYILSHSTEKWIKDISENFVFSGFDMNIKHENKWIAQGFTNTNESSYGYFQAFLNSGVGKQETAKIAPQRTSMYFSLGFEEFNKFYKNYQILQESKALEFKEIEEKTKQIEKLLEIDIEKDFFDWIDNEIALLKLEPMSQEKNNDFALVLKAKNQTKASIGLNKILKQIKKKTPVKFKEINYKGYPIKFMSIKGFFKLFLGGTFKQLSKPYYTIIDEYVIFSNHPNTLKYIITNYIENNTLQRSVNYKEFKSNFEKKSNLFIYINTPMIYNSLMKSVDISTREKMDKNQEYFTSFSQIGLQLLPKDDLIKSKIVVQYKDQESILYSDEFKPPTVGPNIKDTINEKQIVIIKENDPFDVIDINPEDLNAKVFIKKYKNGQVKIKVPLKNGMKHGMYRAYYKNGELYFKGRFKKDKRVGKWKKYNMEGKKILQMKY
jgi:antitoxin component YwqK of YwqJK toxin-antitoxin module